MNKIELKLAYIVSLITHPVFTTLWIFLIVFNLNTYPFFILNPKAKLLILVFVLINNILIPIAITYLLLKMKLVSSLDIFEKKQRTLPLLVTITMLLFTYINSVNLNLPILWNNIVLVLIIVASLSLIINFFYKISLHLTALGTLISIVIYINLDLNYDSIVLISILFLLSGLTAYSRLVLNAHSKGEVIAGFLFGSLFTFVLTMILF